MFSTSSRTPHKHSHTKTGAEVPAHHSEHASLLMNGPTPEKVADSVPPGLTLGLALGGGAARGFAHIGILVVLERHGIRPHLVAGSSIGAIVGGLWAAGKIDALNDWALNLNRSNMLGFLDFTLNGGGLIAGRRLKARMRQEVGHMALEDLLTPFIAVATECNTGREIWLKRGDFVSALRASYALPGLFTPVQLGELWLMDGALVNPVPVTPVRASGADFIIAVDLNGDAFAPMPPLQDHGGACPDTTPEDGRNGSQNPLDLLNPARLRRQFLPTENKEPGFSLPAVITDALNITQDRVTRARLAEDPPEILITPALRDVGLFDFHRARDIIDIGIAAGEAALPDIRAALQAAADKKEPAGS